MIAAADHAHHVVIDPVDHPVLFGDAPGPTARQLKLLPVRLADALEQFPDAGPVSPCRFEFPNRPAFCPALCFVKRAGRIVGDRQQIGIVRP